MWDIKDLRGFYPGCLGCMWDGDRFMWEGGWVIRDGGRFRWDGVGGGWAGVGGVFGFGDVKKSGKCGNRRKKVYIFSR